MKLISFDIGIKNMAFCIFIVEGNTVKVQDWGILNLMDECELPQKCTCKLAKKNSDSNCNSKAKYMKNGKYYCEKSNRLLELGLVANFTTLVTRCRSLSFGNVFKKYSSKLKKKQ